MLLLNLLTPFCFASDCLLCCLVSNSPAVNLVVLLGWEKRSLQTCLPSPLPALLGRWSREGRDFGCFFPKCLPGYWHLPAKVLFSACTLKAVVLFGSLANKDNSVLMHFLVPLCSPEFLFNNYCNPTRKALRFCLRFLLYFRDRLSLGLGMEYWGNYGFSSFTLLFWWLGNVILNQHGERDQSLPCSVAVSEVTLKPETSKVLFSSLMKPIKETM